MYRIEGHKWDLEREVQRKHYEVYMIMLILSLASLNSNFQFLVIFDRYLYLKNFRSLILIVKWMIYEANCKY